MLGIQIKAVMHRPMVCS